MAYLRQEKDRALESYEIEINISLSLLLVAYYFVYWSFFMVLAHKLAARKIWLALIPGVKVYLLRKMSGKEYKTGRSLALFFICYFAWIGAMPISVVYTSSILALYAVFWSGILLYLIYRGAMLATIAGRLEEPPSKAFLYGVPLIGFVLITIAAFSSRQTIHEQQRAKRRQLRQPVEHRVHIPGGKRALHESRRYTQQYREQGSPSMRSPQTSSGRICSLCGEINPPVFIECQNCGNRLFY